MRSLIHKVSTLCLQQYCSLTRAPCVVVAPWPLRIQSISGDMFEVLKLRDVYALKRLKENFAIMCFMKFPG